MKNDTIKHPSHYVGGRKFEPKDVIRDWGLNFNLGNAVKYLARAGRKGDLVEDLKKAQEYIQFEIDALSAEKQATAPPKNPNCRCSVNPVFAKMENGDGVSCGVIELEVPVGTPPEDIIRMAMEKINGLEE